ncbi:hypothetical protein CYLTODRAFT_415767 [Cylindrobasidium torrendii FP15055 ss-10]|uniref:GHMP kinase N-terminal domain-containing protein n=1 Tax=Cylindrobasidium torrendii FP15055 ss-10 TaxID=1314674 RepID=A0A0D7ARX9_9AGAR|nr:hypothetical protein CYLTODRAFT_415767 [Cylindrobasidium torrendii FP15055 ss-10]
MNLADSKRKKERGTAQRTSTPAPETERSLPAHPTQRLTLSPEWPPNHKRRVNTGQPEGVEMDTMDAGTDVIETPGWAGACWRSDCPRPKSRSKEMRCIGLGPWGSRRFVFGPACDVEMLTLGSKTRTRQLEPKHENTGDKIDSNAMKVTVQLGEHIDYCLFGVLPAAVERDILIAIAPRVHDVQGRAIPLPTTFCLNTPELPLLHPAMGLGIPQCAPSHGAWKSTLPNCDGRAMSRLDTTSQGTLNHYFTPASPVPVDLLVTGLVPAGSGLSSSAAMVVASTLAFLTVNGKLEPNLANIGTKINKDKLFQLAFSFFPTLLATPVALPPGTVFVCANSLVVSDKAASAEFQYNPRVVETLAAARALAPRLGVKVGPKEAVTLREVLGRHCVGETEGEEISVEKLEEALVKLTREVEGLRPATSADGQLGVKLEEMVALTGLDAATFDEL